MHFPTNFLAIFAFSFLLIGVTLSMRSSKKTEEEGEKDENQAELETEKLNPGGQQGISIPGRRMSKLLQVGKLTQQNSDVSRDEHIENDWDPEGRHDMTMPGRVFGYFDKKSSIPGNEDYFDKWDTEGPEAISIASRDRILNPQPIIREEQWPIAGGLLFLIVYYNIFKIVQKNLKTYFCPYDY